MSDVTLETIKTLQEAQKSTKIVIGSTIGIILIFFFFTFAQLVDRLPPIFFTIETVVAAIITPMLFVLNRISFSWLKMRKGNKPEFKETLAKMNRNDVDEKPEKILERIQG